MNPSYFIHFSDEWKVIIEKMRVTKKNLGCE